MILKKRRLNAAERKILKTVNQKLDYLCLREKERGHMTEDEKNRFKNLSRYHKKLVFGR